MQDWELGKGQAEHYGQMHMEPLPSPSRQQGHMV